MVTTEELIGEMQEIKTQYPSLENSEILTLFQIKALRELTIELSKLRMSK